jgi:DNA-binding LacI/PurR family transcriptional regulator
LKLKGKFLMSSLRPTLRDVAKQAGVSLGTASNVMNNKANISAEIRNRVLESGERLGYQHPVRANLPKSRPLSVIGMIVKRDLDGSPTINPFYSYVMAGIEHECQPSRMSKTGCMPK